MVRKLKKKKLFNLIKVSFFNLYFSVQVVSRENLLNGNNMGMTFGFRSKTVEMRLLLCRFRCMSKIDFDGGRSSYNLVHLPLGSPDVRSLNPQW